MASFMHLHHPDFSQKSSHIWGYTCGGNGPYTCASIYAHPPQERVLIHILNVSDGCGMQFERFYSLNHSLGASFVHLHHPFFQPTLPNLAKQLWWWFGLSVNSYSHWPQKKVIKHLNYISDGCGMQFERFHSLNHSVVAHHGVPFAPPTASIQWIDPIWCVGGHPKGLAEGG